MKCDECGGMGTYWLMPDGERVECSMCEGSGETGGLVMVKLSQDEALSMLEKLRPQGHDARTTAIDRPLAIAIYRAWASDLKHDTVPFEELADCTKDAFLRAAEAAREILRQPNNDPKSSE